MDNETLRRFIFENPKLVRVNPSVKYPGLSVVKYTRDVFYSGKWMEELFDMRGAVIDQNYDVQIMPFRKIFNRFENGTDLPRDEYVHASRKVNGFMIAVTYVPSLGKAIVSSTGSLDSQHCELAEQILRGTTNVFEHVERLANNGKKRATWLFEIVTHGESIAHPIDDAEGVYLLAVRDVSWDGEYVAGEPMLDHIANDYMTGVKRPEWETIRWSDLCEKAERAQHEGYVAYPFNKALPVVKLKTPYYKTIKRLGRMRPDLLLQKSANGTLAQEIPAQHNYIFQHLDLEHLVQLDERKKFQLIRDCLKA